MRYYAKKIGWVGNVRQGWSLSDRGIVWATYDRIPPSKKFEKVAEGELVLVMVVMVMMVVLVVVVMVLVMVVMFQVVLVEVFV